MNISKISSNNPSFSGIYDNKFIKNCLKFAAENGALFTASTQLFFSTTVRPIAIFSAPNTTKENKQVACAKSLTSSLLSFFIIFGVSLPLAKSIAKIDAEPQKYLNPQAIKNLKIINKSNVRSKNYILATQLFKLGIGLVIAMPKAILSASLTPKMFKSVFKQDMTTKNQSDEKNKNLNFKQKANKNFKNYILNLFDKCCNFIAKKIGNILNKPSTQKFSDKYKDANISLHVVTATDLIAMSTFIHKTKKSDIQKDKKNILIYNTLISTGLTVIATYVLEFLLKDKTNSICEKIRTANINDKNVEKYVEGFKIAKPILLMAFIYYALIPLFSTKLSEDVYRYRNNHN